MKLLSGQSLIEAWSKTGSKSNQVEQWFEQQLRSHIKVNFMGDVSWFLGQQYDWHTDLDGHIACRISQQAFIDQILDKNNTTECCTTQTPYRSGLKIDQIDHNGFSPESKKQQLVTNYQSILGG